MTVASRPDPNRRDWLPQQFARAVWRFRDDPTFRVVFDREGVMVFRRNSG
jgi:hypothetical protein